MTTDLSARAATEEANLRHMLATFHPLSDQIDAASARYVAARVLSHFPTATSLLVDYSDQGSGFVVYEWVEGGPLRDAEGQPVPGWTEEDEDDISDCLSNLSNRASWPFIGPDPQGGWVAGCVMNLRAALDYTPEGGMPRRYRSATELGIDRTPDETKASHSARLAAEVLDFYAALVGNTGVETETNLADLLADLRHWSDREGIDYDEAAEAAAVHYDAERDEDDGAAPAPPPAPLAQLREVNAAAWEDLMRLSDENPGMNYEVQARAAELLDAPNLARELRQHGPGASFVRTWPELRPAR